MEYRRITQIKSTDGLLDLRGERRWRLSDADERPVARLARGWRDGIPAPGVGGGDPFEKKKSFT